MSHDRAPSAPPPAAVSGVEPAARTPGGERFAEAWLVLRVPLLFICLVPLLFSLRSLGDPFGQTEEAVNAAIWGLAGRNLLERGPVAARFGASIVPYLGIGGGTYAHHPPLAVWLSALTQLLGTWEGWPRLVALVLAGLSLFILCDTLCLFVPQARALLATGVVATSTFVLADARMFTTLTLATPLFLVLLRAALWRGLRGRPWRWTFLAAIVATVFSSWDGVLGAGAVVLYVTLVELRAARRRTPSGGPGWARVVAPAVVGTGALVVLFAYLVWANGGIGELVTQVRFRAGMDGSLPSFRVWALGQVGFLGAGLGWLTLALLGGVAAAGLGGRLPAGLGLALLLAAAPGLGMILIFRNGAHWHGFWGYNLILPAAFAVAHVARAVEPRRRVALALHVLLGIQAVTGAVTAGELLGRDRLQNSNGALARDFFRPRRVRIVRMMSAYDFHPYVSWYLRVPTDVVVSRAQLDDRFATGAWTPRNLVLVDLEFLRDLGCRPVPAIADSANRRWVVARAEAVEAACAPAPPGSAPPRPAP
jgi:hypothetical protein